MEFVSLPFQPSHWWWGGGLCVCVCVCVRTNRFAGVEPVRFSSTQDRLWAAETAADFLIELHRSVIEPCEIKALLRFILEGHRPTTWLNGSGHFLTEVSGGRPALGAGATLKRSSDRRLRVCGAVWFPANHKSSHRENNTVNTVHHTVNPLQHSTQTLFLIHPQPPPSRHLTIPGALLFIT